MTVVEARGTDELPEAQGGTKKLPRFIGRVGIAFMEVPHQGDNRVLYSDLVKALADDARVRDIQAPQFAEAEPTRPILPWSNDSIKNIGPELPTSPTWHRHIFVLAAPITFSVTVPRRLQGPIDSEVPAECYWVAWDGFALDVMWEFPADLSRNPVGDAGGVVVLDVIQKALEKLDAELDVEPCGPHCSYPFAHMDLVFRPDEDAKAPFAYSNARDTNPTLKNMVTVKYRDDLGGPADIVSALSHDLKWVSHSFARLRSEGKTVVNLHAQARDALQKLLAIYYRRSAANIGSAWWRVWRRQSWATLRGRVAAFGWRRESARYIATLWLLLATLEARRYDWHTRRFTYDSSMKKDERALIFSLEYAQEMSAVEGLEVASLRAATEQAAARLDTNAIAKATLAGAVAGGTVGAIATAIAALT